MLDFVWRNNADIPLLTKTVEVAVERVGEWWKGECTCKKGRSKWTLNLLPFIILIPHQPAVLTDTRIDGPSAIVEG